MDIKIGWLKDSDGIKFAPKTLTTQIQTQDGSLIDDKFSALDSRLKSIEEDSILTSVVKIGNGLKLQDGTLCLDVLIYDGESEDIGSDDNGETDVSETPEVSVEDEVNDSTGIADSGA